MPWARAMRLLRELRRAVLTGRERGSGVCPTARATGATRRGHESGKERTTLVDHVREGGAPPAVNSRVTPDGGTGAVALGQR